MGNYCAEIFVKLKPEIKDVKGETLKNAIDSAFGENALECRCGSFYTIKFSAENFESAKDYVDMIAAQILANSVIETYEIKWVK